MDYSKLVKTLRKKLILSQSELAEMIGVSFTTVNRWENGKHEPTIKIKRKIIELCIVNNIGLEEKNNVSQKWWYNNKNSNPNSFYKKYTGGIINGIKRY